MKLVINFLDNNNLILKNKTEAECESVLLAFDKAKKSDAVKVARSCLIMKDQVRTIFWSPDDEEDAATK